MTAPIDTSEATPSVTRSQRWTKVNDLTKPVRLHVALVTFASIGIGVIEAAFLVAVARIALAIAGGDDDVALAAGVTLSLPTTLVVALSVLVARLLLALAAVRVQTGLIYRISTALRTRLASAFLGASWQMQQQQPAGTLQQLVVTFPNQAAVLIGLLTGATGAALSLLAMLVVAFLINPTTTAAVVAALLVLSAALRPIRVRLQRRSESAVRHQVEFSNAVSQVSSLGLEIQAFGVRDTVQHELEQMIEKYAAAERRVGLFSHAISPIYVTLGYAAVVGGLAIVGSVSAGGLESVSAVMLIMLRSLGYGQIVQQGTGALFQVLPYLDAMDREAERFLASPAIDGAIDITDMTPIHFKDVWFSYRPGEPVLKGVNLDIHHGEVIGIVGKSGSGKSTLAQLLLGLRHPDQGTITVAGEDLRNISRTSWTAAIAYVPQEPALITGSIRDNLRFYRSGITEQLLRRALDQSHLREDMVPGFGGLEASVGERGHALSGGQRQRLSIARALASAPRLLLLDEPTSALDTEADQAIRDTVQALRGQVTVVLIAHRGSTLEVCDRVLSLSDGRVSETGELAPRPDEQNGKGKET